MRRLKKIWQSKLVRDTEGVAMVEFGLAVPVLLILTLGGLEFGNYVITHHQIRQLAAMTADNASRLRTPMSEAFVTQLFTGVEKAGAKLSFRQRGRIILSSVENNAANTGQWIRWQRCFGQLARSSQFGIQNRGQNDNTLPNVDGLTAQTGSAIMFAEVRYLYRPLFNNPFSTDQEITHRVAFIVRQRTNFTINGTAANLC